MCSTASWNAEHADRNWPTSKHQFCRSTEASIMQCNVASISKKEFYWWAYRQQGCCAVWRYAQYEPDVTLSQCCIHQEHPSDWKVTCLCKQDQVRTCISTSMWGKFITFAVTYVGKRNVFYYGLSEYAHSLQQCLSLTLYKQCEKLTMKFLTSCGV